MIRTRKEVTPEMVKRIKEYISDPASKNMTLAEIAVACKTSATTVIRVNTGKYDYLLESVVEVKPEAQHFTNIPYEELKSLIYCETVLKEILKRTKLHVDVFDNTNLAISCFDLTSILQTYLPDEFENRVNKLKGGNSK